jgi:catechol 2,3-dioxygenase-like lactoylglutathione lyase family enzyme
MDKMGSNVITQVAIVVKDVEKTARAYAEVFGMPVPNVIITDTEDKSQIRYHGQPTSGRAKLAFFKLGAVSLEIIEPVGGPSTWQEFLDTRGEGIHHIAFEVKGMTETIRFLESKGMPLVQKGEYTGGRYAYMDSAAKLAAILELLEND